MAKPDMAEMMGAMGGMPKAGEEPADTAAPEPKGDGEVSDEEMQHATDLASALKSGDTAGAAAALKRFVKACTEGGYDENEPEEGTDMGDMQS
jgi:hypothetical protein